MSNPAALPADDLIRQKAAEVLARPDFRLESEADDGSASFLLWLLETVLRPILDFLASLNALPVGLKWLVILGLSALLLLLVGHIAWSFYVAIRGRPDRPFAPAGRDARTGPEEWERDASRLAADGDWINAVRHLFRACLVRIERVERRPFRRGITNHELLRRYRTSPLLEPLETFVDTIDRSWYGGMVCREEDYAQCLEEHARVRSLTEGRRDALRP